MSDMLANVGVRIDQGGVTQFEQAVAAAFQRIISEAKAAAAAGESLGGTSAAFQGVQTRGAEVLGASATTLTPSALSEVVTSFRRMAADAAATLQKLYTDAGVSGAAGFRALSGPGFTDQFNAAKTSTINQEQAQRQVDRQAADAEAQRRQQDAEAAQRAALDAQRAQNTRGTLTPEQISTAKEGVLAATDQAAAEQAFAEVAAASRTYLTQIVRTTTAQTDLATAKDQELAGSKDYLAAIVRSGVAQTNLAAAKDQELAASRDYLEAMVRSSITQTDLATTKAQELSASTEYQAALRRSAIVQNDVAAARSAELAVDDAYLKSMAGARLAADRLAGAQSVALGAPENVAASAQATQLASLTAQKVRLAELGLSEIAGETTAETAARIAVQQQADAQRQRLVEIAATRANEAEIATLTVEQRIAQTQLNSELSAQVSEVIKQRLQAGQIGGGSFFQRFQANLGAQGGGEAKLPGEYSTAGALLGSQLSGFGGLALGAAGSYGAFIGVKDIISSATELQTTYAQLQQQLNATGQSGYLAEVKKQVDDVASGTGVAATSIANVISLMTGVFGNVTTALTFAKQAAEISKITGLDMQSTVQELVPVSTAYNQSFTAISDYALKARNVFGVSEADLLKFFSTTAPLAKQFGVNLDELGAIGGSALTHIGTSASSVAEDLNRVFPNLQKNIVPIAGQLQEAGLGGQAQQVATQVGQGNVGAALETLIQAYAKLNPEQQQFIEEQLGSTRGVKDFAAILESSGSFLAYLRDQTNGAGLTAAAFAAQQKTLKGQMGDVEQQALRLGRALYADGVGSALHDLIDVVGLAVGVLSGMAGVFKVIDEATGGIPGKLLEVAAAVKVLQGLGTVLSAARGALAGGGGGPGGSAGPRQADTEATQQNAEALTRTTEVRQQENEQLGLFNDGMATEIDRRAEENDALITTTDTLQETVVLRQEENDAQVTLLGRLGGINSAITGFAGGLGGVTIVLTSVLELVQKIGQIHTASTNQYNGQVQDFLTGLQTGRFTPAQLQALKPPGSGFAQGVSQAFADVGISPGTWQDARREALNLFAAQQPGTNGAPSVQSQFSALADIKLPTGGITVPRNISAELSGLPRSVTDEFPRNSTLRQSDVEQLAKAVEQGKIPIKAAQDFLDYIRTRYPEVFREVQDVFAAKAAAPSGVTPRLPDPATLNQLLGDKATQIVSAYKSGDATLGQAMGALQDQIRELESAQGSGQSNAGQQLQAAQLQYRNLVSSAIKNETDILIKLAGFSGGDPLDAQIRILSAALNNPQLTNVADRQSLVDQLLGDLQKQADKLGQSVAIPTQAIGEIDAELLQQDPLWQAFFNQLGVGTDTIVKVAEDAAKEGETFKQAFTNYEIAVLKQQSDAAAAAIYYGGLALSDEQVQNLEGIIANNYLLAQFLKKGAQGLPDIQAPGQVSPTITPDQAAKQQDELAKAKAEYYAQLAGGGAAAQAQAEITQGQADLTNAQSETGVQGQIDWWKAQTEIVKGNQDAAKAAVQLLDAQSQYYQELAKYHGDDVAAAQLAVQEAAANLRNAPSEGILPGSADYTGLQTRLIQAQANARDTRLQHQEDQIAFEQQMNQITSAQAVSLYEQLLLIPDLTEKERQSIEEKIHSLVTSATDLQFNLPSNISLPNLYEARRLNETPPGQGYIDQRQVNINLQIFNGADANTALGTILDAVGGSASRTYGTAAPPY